MTDIPIEKLKKLHNRLKRREKLCQEERFSIYDDGVIHAYQMAAALLDELIYEAEGGTYIEDPEPWVYADGTRQSFGPGHDSVCGWSVRMPRKIRP